MDTRGLFFLRAKPYEVRAANGQLCWMFWLIERTGQRGSQRFEAEWQGEAANTFIAAHVDALVPGCALRLELTQLRAHKDELRGTVTHAELAPARWSQRDAATPTTFQPQPSAA